MCKCIKRFICLSSILIILFIVITIWGNGGDKFRMFGDKTGGIIKKASNILAEKSDEYKEKADDYMKKLKKKFFKNEDNKEDKKDK